MGGLRSGHRSHGDPHLCKRGFAGAAHPALANRQVFSETSGNVSERKRVELPQRNYLLFHEPIAKAAGWADGPNLWWPEDRAWCVASEIDHPYTYVGGPQTLIDAIVQHPAIEALPAKLTDGVVYDSDKINV